MKTLKIYSFELSGDFATFRKPDTNTVYLTYNNPPYPAILGILGSIAGLSGYSQKRERGIGDFPQFYNNLNDIWISLHPVFPERPVFLKQMVTYNNYHGYGSNDGCLQIIEQILISPRWKIFLYDEHKHHQTLIDNLRNEQTIFTPYLGKNEFRAEINNFKELDMVTEIAEKNVPIKIDSIVLLNPPSQVENRTFNLINPVVKNLSKGMSLDEYFDSGDSQNVISDDGYSIIENYPYAFGNDLHYKFCLAAFTNWEIEPNTLMNETKIFKIRDNGKEQTIQMFNGKLK